MAGVRPQEFADLTPPRRQFKIVMMGKAFMNLAPQVAIADART